MRLSSRFRVRLIWNFSSCSYTHTHTLHTHTHTLPPSVLTLPPVDDFWGPHNGRQATWARLSCLSAGVGVCCASVCVCVPGVCRGSGLEVSTTCFPSLHCTTLNKQTGFYFSSFVYLASVYLHCLFGSQLLKTYQFNLERCLFSFQFVFNLDADFSLTPFQIHLLERNME